jgi:hypothetical protein
LAKYGRLLYVLVFSVAGLYASLLLLSAMWGWQSTPNTLIYACGILFIVRAGFASRAAILRIRGASPPAESQRASRTLFTIGDGIAVGSLAWTAHMLIRGDYRLGTPVVPFGMGLAAAYLFYLIAVCLRIADK